jgi:hypothetical protein
MLSLKIDKVSMLPNTAHHQLAKLSRHPHINT